MENRFLIVNVGSRGEYSNYIGSWKDVNELVSEFFEFKNESENGIHFNLHDSDVMEIGFGGISDKECLLEVIFDVEDSYYVYELNGSEVKSSEWTIVEYVDDDNYRLEMD